MDEKYITSREQIICYFSNFGYISNKMQNNPFYDEMNLFSIIKTLKLQTSISKIVINFGLFYPKSSYFINSLQSGLINKNHIIIFNVHTSKKV